jgi:hypothetical protein
MQGSIILHVYMDAQMDTLEPIGAYIFLKKYSKTLMNNS